jgi:hypothetical protein
MALLTLLSGAAPKVVAVTPNADPKVGRLGDPACPKPMDVGLAENGDAKCDGAVNDGADILDMNADTDEEALLGLLRGDSALPAESSDVESSSLISSSSSSSRDTCFLSL